jgi:serine/threonine protein phosphatase 1
MTPTTYAIGDIHGRLDLLDDLLSQVEQDASRRGTAAKVVFTGDFVDRGADSFGVVERLLGGPRRPGDSFVCLRGNHDDLFARMVGGERNLPEWACILFDHTIASYDAGADTWRDCAMLRRHAEQLAALPLFHDDGVNFFVHAGIRPGVALEAQIEHDLLWIRGEFLDHDQPLPRRVVHGHTIMGDRPVVKASRVSIDTGAFRSGILTAAILLDDGVEFLQAVGSIDRGAVVREELLSARVQGRIVPPATQRSYDAFLAGDIDLAEMMRRTVPAAA